MTLGRSAWWMATVTAVVTAACGNAATDAPKLSISAAGGAQQDLGLVAADAGTTTAVDPGADASRWRGGPDGVATDAADPPDAGSPVGDSEPTDGAGQTEVSASPDAQAAVDVPAVPDVPAMPDVPVPVDVPAQTDLAPAVDSGAPAPVCGNGVCQAPAETATNCPSDCAPSPQACLLSKCSSQAAACNGANACVGVVACAKGCVDLTCFSNCSSAVDYTTLTALVTPLAKCALAQGCLAAAKPGPGGGPGSCGNGACDNNETHLTCPKDCVFPVSASEQCQVQQCAALYGACASDFACVAAATCWNQGGGYQTCVKPDQAGKVLNQLINCVQTQCSNPTSTPTCKGQCGKAVQGGKCWCDSQCKKSGDCCPDYATFCGG